MNASIQWANVNYSEGAEENNALRRAPPGRLFSPGRYAVRFEKFSHRRGDFQNVCLGSKMSGIQELDLRLR